jgi:Lar family restriction alleviation protein
MPVKLKEIKLLPCPFCGSVDIRIARDYQKYANGDDNFDMPMFHYCQCSNCFCHYGWHSEKEDAIKVWNTRKEVSLTLDREKLMTIFEEFRCLCEQPWNHFGDGTSFESLADAIISNQKELFKVVK